MNDHVEKVYVILGNDLQDGFKTLDWTIRKWKPNPISIVILHLSSNNISKDFVYTPFGKLPASSVSEEKLQVLRKYEQEKIEKLLSKFITFCGKVKAEILKVEKSDEPIHRVIIDLISRHKITKLVLGLTFLRSSSWRSKNAISGSFYVHQHKPNFCELFIICGGKLVFLRRENEEAVMEDDQGSNVTKKGNIKSWLGKILPDHNSLGRHSRMSASSKGFDSPNLRTQWENCVLEIQNYYEHLLSLNSDEEGREKESDDILLQVGPLERGVTEPTNSIMRSKINEAKKIIRLKKEEAKANAERSAKAEWAISLCNSRVEELEDRIKEEVTSQIEIKKRLDNEKEDIQEIISDIAENKNRLKSILELQSELSSKLQLSSIARSNAETQLEKAVTIRAEMVREIEELRRQRDVLQRRIEFCKEKDAIGMVKKLNALSCGYREYSAEDIRLATDSFSDNLRLKSGGDWTNVYRGRLHNSTVAIKLLNSDRGLSQEDFLTKVKFLNNIRHPHLVALLGFCTEQKCIIFEYMHNGSLREILFSSQRNLRKVKRAIGWHDRIRIAHEVCSGLVYLHMAKPRPIVHGRLAVSNVLLDRNLVAKISGFGSRQYQSESDTRSDIRAFGVLLLHLLTGRNWAGLVEEAIKMDRTALARVLDELAGQWPLDLAEQLVVIAMKCMSINYGPNTDFSVATVLEELDGVRKKANEMVAKGVPEGIVKESVGQEERSEVPGIFLCPIFKDVMKNPHLAADGFSYELEAIEEWLKMGHDTSPMTNLRLKHKFLTPNHTLRFLIQEWHNNKSNVTS
ncbi:putative U-box domain-containing protein 50 [Jatropha curcas]|uniref:putative U-box domain-containing protein 50 n=1 Tax=Jatropha curcas TaxID=180498 RepID=UPI0005FBC76D|nr:putative U-box domain-containing protein 50 [Jatropha curcas]